MGSALGTFTGGTVVFSASFSVPPGASALVTTVHGVPLSASPWHLGTEVSAKRVGTVCRFIWALIRGDVAPSGVCRRPWHRQVRRRGL